MARDGSGVYSKPAGTTAVSGTTIESAKFNAVIDDLVADANTARPVSAGGTGSANAADARTALGVTAANVPFTPTGNVAASTVQAAIAEVDSEKALLAGSASQTFSVAAATIGAHALSRDAGDARYAALAGAAFTGAVSSATGIGNCGNSGLSNTNVGANTLAANTTGNSNTAVGASALLANTTGVSNVAVGTSALQANTTANFNTATGTSALQANTSGGNNTAFGYAALAANTTAAANTAVGAGALNVNTTGASNVAVGTSALQANTTANNNVAVGVSALSANTTGASNTAVGNSALQNNTTGASNLALGTSALAANTTGIQNTATGVQALIANTTGNNNVAHGFQALVGCTTGAQNTAIGVQALSGLTTFTNCSGVGYLSAVTGSNQVQLGDSATTTYVYGTVQNRSDARDKADIRDTKLGLDFVLSLRPVDYRYDMRDSYKPERPAQPDADATPEQVEAYEAALEAWLEAVKLKNITRDGSKKRSRYHSGIIAQELRTAIDAAGFDAKGWGALQDHSVSGGDDVLSVGYDQFIAPLIKAIQELSAKVEKLEAAAKKAAKP